MSTRVFKLVEGSEQYKFMMCRKQIALMTGGFGNGKTAALAVQAIQIASTYEKARVLVGRATRPKLEDSTKPEVIKWCPEEWVDRWPSERRNNIDFKETGSRIEFRHVRQEGKGKGEEQSNLLSATYDAILVDQIDDPEFTYKDFADLVGRLRGTARYIGDDPTMPRVGPQWLRAGANPTRNWLFREVVNPYFVWKKSGIITSKLLRLENEAQPLLDVFNAPTEANSANTTPGYAARMRAVFRGAMGERYISGSWGAYEGLVYPDFDETVHVVHQQEMETWLQQQLNNDALGVTECYDYGQVSPSCYMLLFNDQIGNVFVADGFYEPQMTIKKQVRAIRAIRNRWGIVPTDPIFADPDIFKSKNAKADSVGQSVASMFEDEGVMLQKGSNTVSAGIQKITSYLTVDPLHMHPIKRVYGAPRLFVSSALEFFTNEIVDYYYGKNILGQNVDKPRDANDHAMDALKYGFTRMKKVVGQLVRRGWALNPAVMAWNEMQDDPRHELLPRYR